MSITARKLIRCKNAYCAWPSNKEVMNKIVFDLAVSIIAGNY